MRRWLVVDGAVLRNCRGGARLGEVVIGGVGGRGRCWCQRGRRKLAGGERGGYFLKGQVPPVEH